MRQTKTTLYQCADTEIRLCIDSYLALAKTTRDLADVSAKDLMDERARDILLAGLGVRPGNQTADDALDIWKRSQALRFDLEAGITVGVYRRVRAHGALLLDIAEKATSKFTIFDPDHINSNPNLLPILQHLTGLFSKAALKKQIGSVSDTSVSKPAAKRLSALLQARVVAATVNKGEILQRLESTLEGIVRDLVGRVLLESIVDSALRKQALPFKREEEYRSLSGVVYDFRADFVLPDADQPKAFIEVRKSSSRHASLYAKDKMFSAINWKGQNPALLEGWPKSQPLT